MPAKIMPESKKSPVGTAATVESETSKAPKLLHVKPSELEFDFDNPRLMDGEGPQPTKEPEMIDWLWKNADVAELTESISQSGWMQFDDMVVMKADGANHYVVLEGNRRLAALKLFTKPGLAASLDIPLPDLGAKQKESLQQIWVKAVPSRDDARAFIGFKHVNGPHKWDAYAKAKFAAEWLDGNADLNRIARTLGDTHNTVRRLVIGYRVLEQAKKGLKFRTEDAANPRGFAFSHLYTALGQSGYQKYLGIEDTYYDDSILMSKAPVPKSKLPALKDVVRWLYGDKSEGVSPIIVSQNPNLSELNSVLQSSAALNILKSEGSLSRAFEEVESRSDRFIKALISAYQYADKALQLSGNYDGKDQSVGDTSENLRDASDAILTVVKSRITKAKEKAETKSDSTASKKP